MRDFLFNRKGVIDQLITSIVIVAAAFFLMGLFLIGASNAAKIIGPDREAESFEINLKATSVQNQPIRTIKLDLKTYPSEELDLRMDFPEVVRRGILPDKDIQPLKPLAEGEILLEAAEDTGDEADSSESDTL